MGRRSALQVRPLNEAVDAVVVGAGAAGGVYAHRLRRAGKQVVVLEAGPRKGAGDMVSSTLWARRHKWGGAPVEVGGEHPIAHNISTGSGFGGAAYHHYGTWPRFAPWVFELRSRFGRGLDWGLTYEELRPWYDAVQSAVGIAGDAAKEPWRGRGAPYPMPPLPAFRHGELLAEGFRRNGLPVAPSPVAINSIVYRGRPACLYDGWCDAGCPIGALGNPLVTYLGWAERDGAEVRTDSVVTRVLTGRDGRACGVEYWHGGERHEQRADVVVLAASFVQNPRILLCSGTSRRPGGGTQFGLANSSGLVGRYLFADAMTFVYGLFREPTDIAFGVNAGQYYHHGGPKHSEDAGLFGGYQWQVAPAAKPNDIFGIAITRPELYGEPLHAFIREASEHLAYMVGFVSGIPAAENRVELDPTRRDAFGMPLARTTHRYGGDTLALVEHVKRQGVAVVSAAGANSVWPGRLAGGHVSGGTIMGNDPARSVCNAYGCTHDVPNLLLAGAGVFPHTGGTSPTFTVHALALRSADHLARHWTDYT